MRVLVLLAAAAAALSAAEEFQVATEHPRLLLGKSRLRLLKRERERRSPRWQQFEALMAGKARMPEPGFAEALYWRVADDREAGRRAIAWALGTAKDVRQMALVFDWCQDLLDEAQSRALAAKLRAGIQQAASDTRLEAMSASVMAAIALAGHQPDESASVLERVVREWWEKGVVPALAAGRDPLPASGYYALFEMLHAVRDNLATDLRESSAEYFKELPVRHLLSYYPATYPAGENDYRIPAARGTGEPNLDRAALARAADLAIVAFDVNSPGGQILQGWLMHDRFALRGPFGAPYEFLWANPYQPGLSYYHAPLVLHDDKYGRLFIRSNWDESAPWLGTVEGEVQVFRNGRVSVLDPQANRDALELTEALVFFAKGGPRYKARLESQEHVFVLGLKPAVPYLLEVDDEEVSEEKADRGGILAVDLPAKAETAFRLRGPGGER